MRQHVLYRDLAVGRHDVVLGVARGLSRHHHGWAGLAGDGHLGILELGHELGDRVVQADLSLFDEHHDGYGGNRLGHRSQAEDRVLGHRSLGFDIRQALSLKVRDSALAGNQRNGAGDVAGVDVTLDGFADPAETLR